MSGEKELQNFWDLLYEKVLEPNEYIRITIINEKYTKVFFIKSLAELQEIIKKYRHVYNIYANLSTIKGDSGGEEKDMYRRKILFFDFDKKDFPDGFNFTSAKELFKSLKVDGNPLYFHYGVDSGGGYHLYIQTQTTENTTLITDINKRLAEHMNADVKACSLTQIVRIPTSFNFKAEKHKRATTIVPYNPNKDIRYTFKKLNHILLALDKEKPTLDAFHEAFEREQKKKAEYDGTGVKFCCEKMLIEGVSKGHRNECHGRILNYLRDVKKFSRQDTYRQIYKWNERCNPPKDINILEKEFNMFWERNYNLLGCNPSNQRSKEILACYCDRYKCIQTHHGEIRGEIKQDIRLENEIFKTKNLKKLKGNEYFILSVLKFKENGMSRKELEEFISNNERKPALSKKPFERAIKILDEMKLIKIIKGNKKENDFYIAKNLQNFNLGNTWTSWALCKLVIDKIITIKQFLVYILLSKAIQDGKKTTAEEIAKTMSVGLTKELTKENVRQLINKLDKAKVLSIKKHPLQRV